MKLLIILQSIALLFLGFTQVGHSAILAEYTFDNPTGGATDLTSSDTDPNSTAGIFGSGAGFAINTTAVTTGFTSEGLGLSDGTDDDLAGAIAADDYFTFDLTAASGAVLDLDQIDLDVSVGLRGARDFYLFSDVGGFTVGAEIGSALDLAGNGSASITANLTGPAFQGLSSIEFRVYVDDRLNNNSSSSATAVDNIVVLGDAVIPEPQTWLLTLTALLGLMFVRRKRACC